ncbi:HD domain-containing protein [Roseitranquillus sediminis]|uniref:HD domain-containing protein n=1 Tax=Roseitranquillus sediminis TaxID=2809051 RepID=UPI001D0C364F|nr:HD domain-containing protein [Roseitranquillus sediminis]MBM9594335.1 bifunctional (p)ppGpp synthetase/guanosine-3',5'-bis(diphosphate) 3'-pyrophosphohydrolase [Roseitranquillus sediminis]
MTEAAQGDVARMARAFLVAARAHIGQTRKGKAGIPYINHPAEVAELVAWAGGDVDTVVAAVLHDVVEDSETTVAEIAEAFGPQVARLVEAMTNPPEWEELPKIEMKLRQAQHMGQASAEARMIKIADQTSNLRDIAREPEAWEPMAAERYLEGAGRVVDACRGTSAALEAAFDEAMAIARQRLGGTLA